MKLFNGLGVDDARCIGFEDGLDLLEEDKLLLLGWEYLILDPLDAVLFLSV